MRKEIIGIFLFFLVILTLASLLSYSPEDPSIHNARADGAIFNLFGLVGAHLAGLLVGLFGLGAFWLPVLLLFSSLHFFRSRPGRTLTGVLVGGLLLVVTSGSLMALQQSHYEVFGSRFSAGGLLGIPLKSFLVRYANVTGAAVILGLLWLVGFMLATGFSLLTFSRRTGRQSLRFREGLRQVRLQWQAKRELKRQQGGNQRKRAAQKAPPPIEIKTPPPPPPKSLPAPQQEEFAFMRQEGNFRLPAISFLEDPPERSVKVNSDNLRAQSQLIEKKLEDFGVNGKVVAVTPGPVITTYEYEPAAGVKINKIVNLSDDLALALRALSIRTVAIPGKSVIGIEVPNEDREMVCFKEVVGSRVFEKARSKLPLCLGKDIVGNPVVADLEKMPHLLIAGATGAGKSVALNAMICSFLYRSTPEDIRLIMVDPKRIELSLYDGIPHLITPVVTDVSKATNALFWAVREMEHRYELLSRCQAKNIHQYNQKIAHQPPPETEEGQAPPPEKLPLIVIIIDELADLMMVASRDVEVALTRLAQMARAAGIHLILATQRPSVDVLTGIIKANFPTRLTFQVSSKTDSRTIIDANGAENLLGNGDMLFMPPGTAKLQRIHGAYISEAELERITAFLREQQKPDYDAAVIEAAAETQNAEDAPADFDERYDEAVALVTRTGQASISMVQRHLRIGYNRAARIIETMEKEGVVGPSDGVKPREVIARGFDGMP